MSALDEQSGLIGSHQANHERYYETKFENPSCSKQSYRNYEF